MSQAHKLHDNIHDVELSTMDARTVGEVGCKCCCRLHWHFRLFVACKMSS